MQLKRKWVLPVLLAAATAPSFAGDVFWMNDADGFWDEATNWAPNLPQNGDRVFIQRPNANITTTYRSGSLTLLQLLTDERFVMAGGALTLSTLGPRGQFNSDFSLFGGTLAGYDFEVLGSATFAGGALTGNGRVIARGPTAFTGAAPLNFSEGRQLFTFGPVTVSGAQPIWMSSGATWEVGETTVVEFNGDNSFLAGPVAPGILSNRGVIRKSAGTGVSNLQLPLQGPGSVEVLTGRLNVGWPTGENLFTGTIQIAEGATFGWHGGAISFSSSQLQGPGTLALASGAVSVGNLGLWTRPVSIEGATVTITTHTDFQPKRLAISGGTFNATMTTQATEQALFRGGALAGPAVVRLRGATVVDPPPSTSFVVRNNVRLINQQAFRSQNGAVLELWDSLLENAPGATITLESNTDIRDFGATPLILNRGTIRKEGDAPSSVSAPFDNGGTLQVENSRLTVNDEFFSSGSVVVSSAGELELRGETIIVGSVTGDGHFRFAPPVGLGQAAFLPGSNINLSGRTTFSGPTTIEGQITSLGRQVHISSLVTFPQATVNVPLLYLSHTAAGPVTLVVTDSFVSDSALLQGGAKMVVTGADNSWQLPGTAANSSVENRGTILFGSTSGFRTFAGQLLNTTQGVISVQPAGAIIGRPSDTGLIRNEGLLLIPNNNTSSRIEVRLLNLGVVNVRAGTLAVRNNPENFANNTLTGGTWLIGQRIRMGDADIRTNKANIELNAPTADFLRFSGFTSALANFNLNAAEGRFAVTNGAKFTTGGGFTNNGELAIGPEGEFNVTGNLVSGPNSVLAYTLGGRPNGKLKVSGEWAVDGKLKVTWGDGFTPAAGNMFDLAQFDSATGEELELDAPTLPGGLVYRWAQSPTTLGLTITVPADTDGSGCVDDADVTNLILDFGGAGGANGETDINADGIVDDADLTEIILAFGAGC